MYLHVYTCRHIYVYIRTNKPIYIRIRTPGWKKGLPKESTAERTQRSQLRHTRAVAQGKQEKVVAAREEAMNEAEAAAQQADPSMHGSFGGARSLSAQAARQQAAVVVQV